MSEQSILVTGTAGFIGFHLAKKLLQKGQRVVGVDSLNDYYDVQLKRDRLAELEKFEGLFVFYQLDISNWEELTSVFESHRLEIVVHLAAQAGVRYSLTNPDTYITSNLVGFHHMLNLSRRKGVAHFLYASSSSVYGANREVPFSINDRVDHPVSLYAASKKANELIAHSYSVNFGLPTTGLRFFTVYGPWGRPDMAIYLFTDAILKGKPIDVFNYGEMERDFTYIDDIIDGVIRAMNRVPKANNGWYDQPVHSESFAPYKVYNIGNGRPVKLMDFIQALEQEIGISAKMNFLPMQNGDVPRTWADIDDLCRDTGFKPATDVQSGIKKFVSWFRAYYKL